MGEILLNPDQVAEGIAYIEALTNTSGLPLPPPFPKQPPIGQNRWAHVDVKSLSVVASLGFSSFATTSADINTQVLVRDYLYTTEIEVDPKFRPIRSISYGAGFRVALAVNGIDVKAGVSFGLIAAQAQVNQKQVSIDIRVIGMPKGPPVPAMLINGQDFTVESYRLLQNFVDDTQAYLVTHGDEAQPLPIAAAITALDGAKLIEWNPAVRFSMWRLVSGASLADALKLAGHHADVDPLIIRTIYATTFRRPELLRPGSQFEGQGPDPSAMSVASQWLNGFRNG